MKEKKHTNFVNRILFLIALAVFLVAAGKLITIGFDYYSADREYRDMQDYIQTAEETEAESAEGSAPRLAVDFAALQEQNEDCIGWIYFENPDISYPVMKGVNNNEYLRTTFFGEARTAGSIFIDADNAADFSDENTFIYGHNMKDGTMFGQLKSYEEEAFYRENPQFMIYTPGGCGYYTIYSCYTANVNDEKDSFAISFSATEEYEEFQKMVKARSLYDTGVEVKPEQKTVTLMTCNKAGEDYRLLIHAVQTAFIPMDEDTHK